MTDNLLPKQSVRHRNKDKFQNVSIFNSNFHLCKLQINSLLSLGLFYIRCFQGQPCPSYVFPLIIVPFWEVGSLNHVPAICPSGILMYFFFLKNLFQPCPCSCILWKHFIFHIGNLRKQNHCFTSGFEWMYLQDRINFSDHSLNIMFKVILPPKKGRRIWLHSINVAISQRPPVAR